jgi:transposase
MERDARDQEIEQLRGALEQLKKELEEIKVAFKALQIENEELRAENKRLKAALSKYEKPKKDSSNSGIPPSKDENRRHYPKREKSGKKPGGQMGNGGHAHSLNESPDEIIGEYPDHCEHCGSEDLEKLEEYEGQRQVVTIRPQPSYVTEYRQSRVKCRHCGKKSVKRNFANQRVEWGCEVHALTGLLKVRHHQSDEKIQSLFQDIYGLKISQASIGNALKRLGKALKPQVEQIREALKKEEVASSDESGNKINGKKGYVWIFHGGKYCLFVSSPSRAYKVIEETFGETFPKFWVSDRYAGQLKVPAKHQLCLVHIIRECRYAIQAEESEWAKSFKELLQEAKAFRKKGGGAFNPLEIETFREIQRLKGKLDTLFDRPPPEKEHEKKLFNGLFGRKEQLFLFLDNPAVPSDNNASEQGVRSRVLHRKNNGGFRSPEGSENHDIIASVLETGRRFGENLLDLLTGKVFLFPKTEPLPTP